MTGRLCFLCLFFQDNDSNHSGADSFGGSCLGVRLNGGGFLGDLQPASPPRFPPGALPPGSFDSCLGQPVEPSSGAHARGRARPSRAVPPPKSSTKTRQMMPEVQMETRLTRTEMEGTKVRLTKESKNK